MATYQGTLIFNQGRYGWTETWYLTQSTYLDAQTKIVNYGTTRVKLLGIGARIEAARVSDVAFLQDSLFVPLGLDGTGQGTDADTPWNAILGRFDGGPLYRRQFWMRGVPDDWIILTGGNPNVNPVVAALNSAFGAVRASILANGLQLKVIKKDGAGGVPIDVTGISLDANGFLQFNIAGLTGGPNATFRISGMQGPDPKIVNGVYKIKSNNAALVVTTFKPGVGFDPTDYAAGTAKPRIVEYISVTGGQILRTSKRSTGRAFFVSRGRRRRTS